MSDDVKAKGCLWDWDWENLSRADLALLRRAARERWGVPDALRTEAIAAAARMLADPSSTKRERLSASKFLLAADRTDQVDDKLDLDRAKLERAAGPSASDDYELDLG